jgi:hypothetical protein
MSEKQKIIGSPRKSSSVGGSQSDLTISAWITEEEQLYVKPAHKVVRPCTTAGHTAGVSERIRDLLPFQLNGTVSAQRDLPVGAA